MAHTSDPDKITGRDELAAALTALRTNAGFTVRALAARINVPPATLGGYLSGRHIPSAGQSSLVIALVQACGVDDADSQRAWLDAFDRVRRGADGRAARTSSPYRGLEAFGPGDAALFFGRRQTTGAIIGAVQGHDSPVFVVGPSGSGKSSVLRAGVLPAIRDGAMNDERTQWTCVVMTPGSDPFDAYAEAVAEIGDQPVVLIVDQFEELYTSCEPQIRETFLVHLRAQARVIVGLRADFYAEVSAEPLLIDAVQSAQIVVGPLGEAELREVIAAPAIAVGAAVSDDLIELLISELTPAGAIRKTHDSGALPLLSHALLATWRIARRSPLTVSDYRTSGGISGAVQQSAEQVFSGLDEPDRELSRRLFLRLVNIDQESIPTRRRVDRVELEQLGETLPGTDIDVLIERYVAERLLTVDADSVTISHEALLSAWPRLHEWLDADRAGLALHRRLTLAANSWEASNRDDGLLLRGGQLIAVTEWTTDPVQPSQLNRVERDLVAASVAKDRAERDRQRATTKRLAQLLAAVAVLAMLATALGVYGLFARSWANNQRDSARVVRDQALSREVSNEVREVASTDPSLAAQLALAAYRISPTVEARSALIDTTTAPVVRRLVGPAGPTAMAMSDDGRLLAVANPDTAAVTLYRINGSSAPVTLGMVPGAGVQLYGLAVSHDGHELALGSSTGKTSLWDIASPDHPSLLSSAFATFSESVQALTFSPDDRTLIAAGAAPALREWDISSPRAPVPEVALPGLPAGPAAAPEAAYSVAMSPDGRWLAAALGDGRAAVWRTGAAKPDLLSISPGSIVDAVRFSADSTMLAVGTQAKLVDVYRVTGSAPVLAHAPLTGFTSWASAVAFSPDGRTLFAGGADDTLLAWDTSTWQSTAVGRVPGPATNVTASPDGSTLITASADGSIRFWPLRTPGATGLGGSIFSLAFSHDGSVLGVGADGAPQGLSLWASQGSHLTQVGGVTLTAAFGPADGAAAVNPAGTLAAIANTTGGTELFSITDRAHAVLLGSSFSGDSDLIESLAFNPAGTLLAVGADDGGVRLWDVTNPSAPRQLGYYASGVGGHVLNVAFSPNGRYLAAASSSNVVHLWDVSAQNVVTSVATLTGFTTNAWALTFSTDSQLLVASSADHSTLMWSLNGAKPKRVGPRLTGPTNYASGLAFSPDGKQLAIASNDSTEWLWDVADPAHPTLLATLRAATGLLNVTTFAASGTTLLAAGGSQQIYSWNTDAAADAAEVCRSAGSVISRAEWTQYIPGAPYDPPCARRS